MRYLFEASKVLGRRIFKKAYARRVEDFQKQRPHRITSILAQKEPPVLLDNTGAFDELQKTPQPSITYGYDKLSCWKRGVERAAYIIETTGMIEPGSSFLEIACGDGMTSAALSNYGHHLTLLDLQDWRDSRATMLKFEVHNMANVLPYTDDSFDVVFSYNSFEHIPDPRFSLNEMVRVIRPGGFILLDFDPLYSSAWGLHAWRSLKMPYPQFLFSEEFITSKLKTLGLYDLGKQMTSLQPLNHWRVGQFREIWSQSGCNIIKLEEITDTTQLSIVESFPDAFQGRDLTFDDLVVRGIRVVLFKPN